MPTSVRVAISENRDIFRQSERLARRLRVTRSRLYSMAMQEFLRRHENDELLARFNDAYADGPDPEEKAWLDAALLQAARLAKGQW
jgi:predicted transcriptional regulator